MGERRAVLVRVAEPDRTEALRRGGWDKAGVSECWLVEAPDGPARVWWVPRTATLTTVIGPGNEFNSAALLRRYGHRHRAPMKAALDERDRIFSRLRAREDREEEGL